MSAAPSSCGHEVGRGPEEQGPSARTPPAEHSPWLQAAALAFRVLLAVTILAALGWVASNVRQVPPESRAMVLRFGDFAREAGPGLLIAWPSPIETVVLLPSAERVLDRRINLSFGEGSGSLLTGDNAIVLLEARVYYRIEDVHDFLLEQLHAGPALDRLFAATEISVAAARDIDEIVVARPELAEQAEAVDVSARRSRFRDDLVAEVNRRLEELRKNGRGLGIRVVRIDVASTVPAGAKAAFEQVLTASQNAERVIAEARTRAAGVSQKADQEIDAMMRGSVASAAETVAQAKSDTEGILRLAGSFPLQDRPTLEARLYRERLPSILRKAGQVLAADPSGGPRLILRGKLTP